jgi:hypothetical protein
MSYYTNEPSGISCTGVPLDPNASGSLNTGIYPYGYGQVYGIYWNTGVNTSYGLASHNLNNLIPPVDSGSIYWSQVPPLGQEVQLKFSGLNYFDQLSNRIFYDDSGVLGVGNGMIADFEIKPIKSGLEDIVESSIAPSLFYLSNGSLASLNEGIFITKERFACTGNFYSGGASDCPQTLSGLLNSLIINQPLITGYVAYASGEGMQMFDGGGNFKDYMNGGILKTPIERSDLYLKPFTVYTQPDKIYYGTGLSDSVDCWRVTDFFSSNEERMTDLKRRLEITVSSESKYVTFFTGYDSGTNNGLYLTYIKGHKSFYCPPGSSLDYPSSCSTSIVSGIYTNDNGFTGLCFRCLNCDPCPSGSKTFAENASLPCSYDLLSSFSYVNECGQTGNCMQCASTKCEEKHGLKTLWEDAIVGCPPGKSITYGFGGNTTSQNYLKQVAFFEDGDFYFCWKCVHCPRCENINGGFFIDPIDRSDSCPGYAPLVRVGAGPECGTFISCFYCGDGGLGGVGYPYPPPGPPTPPLTCDGSVEYDSTIYASCYNSYHFTWNYNVSGPAYNQKSILDEFATNTSLSVGGTSCVPKAIWDRYGSCITTYFGIGVSLPPVDVSVPCGTYIGGTPYLNCNCTDNFDQSIDRYCITITSI